MWQRPVRWPFMNIADNFRWDEFFRFDPVSLPMDFMGSNEIGVNRDIIPELDLSVTRSFIRKHAAGMVTWKTLKSVLF